MVAEKEGIVIPKTTAEYIAYNKRAPLQAEELDPDEEEELALWRARQQPAANAQQATAAANAQAPTAAVNVQQATTAANEQQAVAMEVENANEAGGSGTERGSPPSQSPPPPPPPRSQEKDDSDSDDDLPGPSDSKKPRLGSPRPGAGPH